MTQQYLNPEKDSTSADSAVITYSGWTHHGLWKDDGDRTRRPVFIIGIHRRSGTNFLADAICLTSRFSLPVPLYEDYLLQYSNMLLKYTQLTAAEQYEKRFSERPNAYTECKRLMLRSIGDGLLAFLRSYIPDGCRILTKTPDPWNLNNFFPLFPDALLIIIVRDGRDCVESAKWAFPGRSYLYWMTTWAANARTIINFLKEVPPQHEGQLIVTRYEDLLSDEAEMNRILEFIGCCPQEYPWNEFRALPVRGSTFFRGEKNTLHWQPVDKTKDFQPVGRWKKWSWWLRWNFKRVAGAELVALGYRW
jgi:hypothetical protein